VKITVRCGVLDRGKPCGRKIGSIERKGFPGPEWFRDGNYDRLAWEERHYDCPKHGAMQVHEADLLHLALKPRRRVIVATSVEWLTQP
jgi:hypothetical protein